MSMDVAALYPSLKVDTTEKILDDVFRETDINFENVNYVEIGKYLSVHLDEHEIREQNLVNVIPVTYSGRHVSIAYLKSDTTQDGKEKWVFKLNKDKKPRAPTNIQKRKMLSHVFKILD